MKILKLFKTEGRFIRLKIGPPFNTQHAPDFYSQRYASKLNNSGYNYLNKRELIKSGVSPNEIFE